MINLTVRYFDKAGNPVETAEEAYYTQAGSVRTCKGGPAELLVKGKWIPIP